MDLDAMHKKISGLLAFAERAGPLLTQLEEILKKPPVSSEAIAEDVKAAMGVLKDAVPALAKQQADVEKALEAVESLAGKFDELKTAVDAIGAVVPQLAEVKSVVDKLAPLVDKIEEVVADYEKLKAEDELEVYPVGAEVQTGT